MNSSRIGYDETMNQSLIAVKPGDTIAFEIKDPRNKWRWSLGVVLSQPMPRITEVELWKKRDKVLSEEERAKAKALQEKIDAQRKGIEEKKAATQKKLDMLAEKRQAIVVTKANAVKRLEEARAAMAKAKQEVEHIDDKDIREIRSYKNPSDAVRMIMEAVSLILDYREEGSSGNTSASASSAKIKVKRFATWEDVQQQLKQTNFISQVANYDSSNMSQTLVDALNTDRYLKNPKFNAQGAGKASKAVQRLEAWVEVQVNNFNANKNNATIEEDVSRLNKEIEAMEQQGVVDEQTLRVLQEEIDKLEDEHEGLVEEQDEIEPTIPYVSIADNDVPPRDETFSQSKKAEWMATNQKLHILTTSILSNLENSVHEEYNETLGSKSMRVDTTKILASARMGQTLRMGDSLQMLAKGGIGGGAADQVAMEELKASKAALEAQIKELEEANQKLKIERDLFEKKSQQNTSASPSSELRKAEASIKQLQEEKDELMEKLLARGKGASEMTDAIRKQLLEAHAEIQVQKVNVGEMQKLIDRYKTERDEARGEVEAEKKKTEAANQATTESRKHTDNTLENLKIALVKVKEITAESDDAKKRLSEAEAKLKESEERYNEVSSSLEDADVTIAELREFVDRLRSEADETSGTIEALTDAKKTITNLKTELATAHSEIAALEAKISEMGAENDSRMSTIKNNTSLEIQELRKELENAQKSLANANKELQEVKETSAAESRAKFKALDAASVEAKSQQGELEIIRKKLVKGDEERKKLKSEIDALNEKVAVADGQLNAVLVKEEDLRMQLNASEHTRAELAAAKDTAEKQLMDVQRQLTATSAEAKALKEQLSEDSSSMASALAASQLAVATLEGEKASLGAEVASMKAQLEAAKQREAEAEERVAGLTREQSSLKTTLASAQSEAAAARAELDALKQQLADAAKGGEAATSALSARVASLEGELVRAKEAAAASSRAQAEVEKQLGEARGESEALSAELESVRKQLRVASEGSEAAAALLAQVAALEAVAKESEAANRKHLDEVEKRAVAAEKEAENLRKQIATEWQTKHTGLAVAEDEIASLRERYIDATNVIAEGIKERDVLRAELTARKAERSTNAEAVSEVGTSSQYQQSKPTVSELVPTTSTTVKGSSNSPLVLSPRIPSPSNTQPAPNLLTLVLITAATIVTSLMVKRRMLLNP